MCGRYTLRITSRKLQEVFHVEEPPGLFDRFDVRPTQQIATVRESDVCQREFSMMRWGLIPHWAPNLLGPTSYNARAVALDDWLADRQHYRRCAIPATGYFEWTKLDAMGRRKQKYLTILKSAEPFAFAGLWTTWTKGSEPILSATVVTTEPNDLAALVHDRMPVMLTGDAIDRWLDPSITDPRLLMPLLVAPPADAIEVFPVQNESLEDPTCVRPIGSPLTLD